MNVRRMFTTFVVLTLTATAAVVATEVVRIHPRHSQKAAPASAADVAPAMPVDHDPSLPDAATVLRDQPDGGGEHPASF